MTRSKPTIEELPRGATIGRYMVLSCLGAGGMGVVYAAYDPELDRKAAIKLLKSGGGGSSGRVRFLREAQAMARLSHPNVINVFDVGTIDNQVFIAMEFVDGGTLNRWLEERPRTQKEILAIFVLAVVACRLPTPLAWSIATSSRTTCSSAKKARSASWTLGCPLDWPV